MLLSKAEYRKGNVILLGNSDGGLYVGKIMLSVVVHNSVHFICEKHVFVTLIDTGIYCDLVVFCDLSGGLTDLDPLFSFTFYFLYVSLPIS